jgi:hypothetical protein
MKTKKYPRTYHFPFSPEIHADDKIHQDPVFFVNKEIVITEKLDGGNTSLRKGQVYARSIEGPATHPSFSMTKNLYSYKSLNLVETVYGENLEGIHSIEYHNLQDCFFVFAVLDAHNNWLSFDAMTAFCEVHQFSRVPLIFRGTFDSLGNLQKFLDTEIKKESHLGGQREGFVVRIVDGFPFDRFSEKVAKYVRAGHVQTDDHWTRNWKRAKINLQK